MTSWSTPLEEFVKYSMTTDIDLSVRERDINAFWTAMTNLKTIHTPHGPDDIIPIGLCNRPNIIIYTRKHSIQCT